MIANFVRLLCLRICPALACLALPALALEPRPPATAPATNDTARLVNIASRAGTTTGGGTLIAGFVITGPGTKTVLVRGVGPGLANFGLSGLLPNPKITLFDSASRPLANNDDFDPSVTPAGLVSGVGAFALTEKNDSALVATLAPGSYTVVLADTADRPGIALIEVYAADSGTARISNLSTRALVGPGPATVIGGIVVQGDKPRRFMIRGIGPTLTGFGVPGVLADPILALTTANGVLIASSDDWGSDRSPADIGNTAAAVGAFPLPRGSKDAAMLVTLAPGSYTALLGGTNNTSGVALLEVYEAP